MASNSLLCGNSSCKEKLPKTGDYALCSQCNKGLHLDTCSGLKRRTWASMGTSAQSAWTCASCRKERKNSSSRTPDPEDPDEDTEVSSLGVQRVILGKVNALMDIKVKIDSIDASMKFLADKYDTI